MRVPASASAAERSVNASDAVKTRDAASLDAASLLSIPSTQLLISPSPTPLQFSLSDLEHLKLSLSLHLRTHLISKLSSPWHLISKLSVLHRKLSVLHSISSRTLCSQSHLEALSSRSSLTPNPSLPFLVEALSSQAHSQAFEDAFKADNASSNKSGVKLGGDYTRSLQARSTSILSIFLEMQEDMTLFSSVSVGVSVYETNNNTISLTQPLSLTPTLPLPLTLKTAATKRTALNSFDF
ncbi:Uncharacterized protein Rs2_02636 [Raphanus sativus]|nr:Uncharacterized protein Rs2_02636 [Raphanus sativus]